MPRMIFFDDEDFYQQNEKRRNSQHRSFGTWKQIINQKLADYRIHAVYVDGTGEFYLQRLSPDHGPSASTIYLIAQLPPDKPELVSTLLENWWEYKDTGLGVLWLRDRLANYLLDEKR